MYLLRFCEGQTVNFGQIDHHFEPRKAPDIKEQYQNDYGSYIGQQAYDYVYQQRNHMQQSLGY